MIKRTLYFGNEAFLSIKDKQLVVKNDSGETTVPVEDIGVVVVDSPRVVLTHSVISELLDNNAVIITCDNKHLPSGLLLPLSGNNIQQERFEFQVNASAPLKKQLWSQTIKAKILNQAAILRYLGKPVRKMRYYAAHLRSGDPDNYEGRAAAFYWKKLFEDYFDFVRGREGDAPNNILNYGYAILRGVIARNLVASGLLPTLGIFHKNRYNAYCLADDIMEPYRPFVDFLVFNLVSWGEDFTELTPSIKKQLLEIPAMDIVIEGKKSPLMVGAQRTTASLAKCFEGKLRKIIYPDLNDVLQQL